MKVVVFTSNNARIHNVPDASIFEGMKNAVIDPDLSAVKGLAPHHWKLEAGKIVPMKTAEKVARDEHILENGADNFVRPLNPSKIHRHRPWVKFVDLAFAFALGAAITEIVHHFTGGF